MVRLIAFLVMIIIFGIIYLISIYKKQDDSLREKDREINSLKLKLTILENKETINKSNTKN